MNGASAKSRMYQRVNRTEDDEPVKIARDKSLIGKRSISRPGNDKTVRQHEQKIARRPKKEQTMSLERKFEEGKLLLLDEVILNSCGNLTVQR